MILTKTVDNFQRALVDVAARFLTIVLEHEQVSRAFETAVMSTLPNGFIP